MLVYYFLPFIVNNRYLLFRVSSGHNSVTVQNRTHVCYELFCFESLILSFPKEVQIPPESPCILWTVKTTLYLVLLFSEKIELDDFLWPMFRTTSKGHNIRKHSSYRHLVRIMHKITTNAKCKNLKFRFYCLSQCSELREHDACSVTYLS